MTRDYSGLERIRLWMSAASQKAQYCKIRTIERRLKFVACVHVDRLLPAYATFFIFFNSVAGWLSITTSGAPELTNREKAARPESLL